MQFGISYTQVCFSELTSQAKEDVQLVSWYSEPSQPQQITSGLKKKNQLQSVSSLFCTQIIKPQIKTNNNTKPVGKCACQRPHLRV